MTIYDLTLVEKIAGMYFNREDRLHRSELRER